MRYAGVLVFMSLAAILYCFWGLSAAIIVQGWNPMNNDQVSAAFGYAGEMFAVPFYVCLGTGVLLFVVEIILAEFRKP